LGRPEPLAAHHELEGFDCSKSARNEWLLMARTKTEAFALCAEVVSNKDFHPSTCLAIFS
jgi:hypothetical protein